jgi:hypothetical protein
LNTDASTSPTTGALTVAGGVGIGGALTVGSAGGSGMAISSQDTRGGGGTITMAANLNGLGGPGLYTTGSFPLHLGANIGLNMTINTAGDVRVNNATSSTSPTTGALTVAGGVGVAGAAYATRLNAGASTIPNVWPLTVKTGPNANFGIFDSGAGTAIGPINDIGTAFQPWQLWGEVKITSVTASTSPTTGALTVAGGVGIGANLVTGDNIEIKKAGYPTLILNDTTGSSYNVFSAFNNFYLQKVGAAGPTLTATNANISIVPTTASTSPTTGALTVAGGLGVSKAIYAGNGILSIDDITTYRAANAATGAYAFGNTATKVLYYDSIKYQFIGGPLQVNDTTASTSPTTGALTVAGGVGIGGTIHTSGGLGLNNTASEALPGAGNTTGGFCVHSDSSLIASKAVGSQVTIFNINVDGINQSYYRSGVMVGNVSVSTTSASFVTSSSAELKEDLKSFDAGNIIDETNVYDFKWRSTGERAYGVIAQQAAEVYPTAVTHSKVSLTAEGKAADDEFWGVDYSKYVPVILQELKALRVRVRELEGGLEGKPS